MCLNISYIILMLSTFIYMSYECKNNLSGDESCVNCRNKLGLTLMACSICQFCYSGTNVSSKLFDLSQNCVLESTGLVLPIPKIYRGIAESEYRIQHGGYSN